MRFGARIAFLILLTVWAGIVIGVSLIATPVKFQAPSLTLETGLEIGRYTYRFFGRVELVLLLATLIAAALAQTRGITWTMLALIVAIIAVERLWLLPFLDHRVSEVLAGGAPSFSIRHKIFAALEIAKATVLILSAVFEYLVQLG